MKKFDLEERLIDFGVSVVRIVESLPATRAGNHLGGQVLRSGTSPALNYGEALGGESRNDFVHKIKLVLKELRETYNCLRIIERSNLYEDNQKLHGVLVENNELIAIFVKSAMTAEKNRRDKAV